jgi:hypothetical protein
MFGIGLTEMAIIGGLVVVPVVTVVATVFVIASRRNKP